MGTRLETLNPEQRSAVEATEGPLLVLAGAGSGKTRVVTRRIARLLAKRVPARAILAVTFTNKAAREMRERIAAEVGARRARELTIGTFHAFCARLLRERGAAIGVPPRFTICDDSDQASACRAALREVRIAESALAPRLLQARISLAKCRGDTPESFLARAAGDTDEIVGRAWRRYEERLARGRSLDFDDLLGRALELLERAPEVLAELRERYRYLLVDEYQDTNVPQYEILRRLAGGRRNLCVVGDDDQSIYGWRGAELGKILGFERDFPGARVVRLETNYRSTSEILEVANRLIAKNAGRHPKRLVAAAGSGEAVRVVRHENELREAEEVVREICAAVDAGRARLRDCAILFRTQSQPKLFEAELRARGVPYVLAGGPSFFDRKEVRDVLAYLRLVANPSDETAFLRVVDAPPRGIGRTSLERALAVATREGASVVDVLRRDEPAEGVSAGAAEGARALLRALATLAGRLGGRDLGGFVRELVATVGYEAEVRRQHPDPLTFEARWNAALEVAELADAHARRHRAPTVASFLEEVALATEDRDGPADDARDAVALSTIHAAKGLEWDRVWLVGLEEGLLPHRRSVAEDGIEEERRLAYVGVTRARRSLALTYAAERSRFGRPAPSMPSRFLYEMAGAEPPPEWRPAGADEPPARAPAAGKKRRKRASGRRPRRRARS